MQSGGAKRNYKCKIIILRKRVLTGGEKLYIIDSINRAANILFMFYIINLIKRLDYFFPLWYSGYTSKRVYFFVFIFKSVSLPKREANNSVNQEVPKNESENHLGLHGVQTAQLQHDEKQEKRSGQT